MEELLKNPKANVNLDMRVERYISKLKGYLKGLDEKIVEVIALATDVEEQGKQISLHMKFEWQHIDQEYNYSPYWKQLIVNRGWKGKMLKQDLIACRDTVGNITSLINGLTTINNQLVAYRAHLDNFKVHS